MHFDKQRQNELREIRLANLTALLHKHQMTQSAFARRIGVSSSAIGQYITGHRALGRAFCSRIEAELCIPAGCMDFPGMAPAAGENFAWPMVGLATQKAQVSNQLQVAGTDAS